EISGVCPGARDDSTRLGRAGTPCGGGRAGGGGDAVGGRAGGRRHGKGRAAGREWPTAWKGAGGRPSLAARERRQSTRRRPVGLIEPATWGSSTTNSVRWAGNTCSLTSTGVPAASRVTRSQTSTGEPCGTSSTV